MTHYTENSGSVRVDYFKPSGKWYMTEAVDMSDYYDMLDIYDAVGAALQKHWAITRGPDLSRMDAWRQFTVVVSEPYHRNAYPVMIPARG